MLDLWDEKSDTKFPEPEIVYKIDHPSGHTLIGIGHLNEIRFHYAPGGIVNSKCKISGQDRKKLIKIISKLKESNSSNSEFCSCCVRESTMLHCGLPLCDDCWDYTSYMVESEQMKRFIPKEIVIQDMDMRNLLFD